MKKIITLFIVFLCTITVFAQQFSEIKKITNPNGAAGDNFGFEVSISGDYAVIGTGGFGAKNSAVVQVLKKDEGGTDNWGLLTELSPVGITPDDEFGWAASIDGDYIAVGAYKKTTTVLNAGAIYVFFKNEGGNDNWGQVAKLEANDATEYDNLGFSIEITGNYIISGAFNDYDAGAKVGSAYIFERTTEAPELWEQIIKLYPSNISEANSFGYEVTISGDNAVVSSPLTTIGGLQMVGAAYLFNKNKGGENNWGEVIEIIQPLANANDVFAYRCDINGENLIIGSFGNNENGTNAGAAYIYNKNFGGDNNWGLAKKIIPNDIAPLDGVGSSVCITDEYAIVGAFSTENDGIEAGSTYIYQNTGTPDSWDEIQEIIPSDPGTGDKYGVSVDFDGLNLIIGSYRDDDYGENSGSAFIYNQSNFNLVYQPNDIQNACSEAYVEFYVAGTGITNYQWQKSIDGSNFSDLSENTTYSGTITSTLSVKVEIELNENYYRCIVSDGVDDITSEIASLYIDDIQPIITCPENQTVTATESNYYTVAGTEFDLISIEDNCEINSIINNYNSSETLLNETFELGTYTITWTVTDVNENISECSFDIIVNQFSNIGAVANQEIKLYPNPSNGTFTIQNNELQIKNIEIIDITGKVIQNQQFVVPNSQFSIKEKGIYFIKLQTENKILTQKIIIQ